MKGIADEYQLGELKSSGTAAALGQAKLLEVAVSGLAKSSL